MSQTYREIKDQYNALAKTFGALNAQQDEIRRFFRQIAPETLVYVGSGSSYCLCRSAELTTMMRLGAKTTALTAGDLMLNYQAYAKVLPHSLLLIPSRSGNTSEVLKAVENSKKTADLAVLGVVCSEEPALAGVADYLIKLPWAFDESVCQTRSVTNLYAALSLLIAYLNEDRQLIADLETAIQTGNAFMAQWEERLAALAGEDWSQAVILADGEIGGLAAEGALAFTEIARVPGQYYHLLDVRHGPMVLIGEKHLAVVALTAEGLPYQQALVQDLLAKGVKVITYSDLPLEPIPGVALQVDSGRKLDPVARGLHFIFLPQILAVYKAKYKNVDPDQPEGLSAWIKL